VLVSSSTQGAPQTTGTGGGGGGVMVELVPLFEALAALLLLKILAINSSAGKSSTTMPKSPENCLDAKYAKMLMLTKKAIFLGPKIISAALQYVM